MGGVGEHGVVGGDDDVGEHRELGVHGGLAVDGGDDGDLYIQQVLQQALAVGVDAVPQLGRHALAVVADPAVVEAGDELVAGAGDDDDLVVGVAADVGEAVAERGVRTVAPHERAVVGVQPELDHAVVGARHRHVRILRRVRVEVRSHPGAAAPDT